MTLPVDCGSNMIFDFLLKCLPYKDGLYPLKQEAQINPSSLKLL